MPKLVTLVAAAAVAVGAAVLPAQAQYYHSPGQTYFPPAAAYPYYNTPAMPMSPRGYSDQALAPSMTDRDWRMAERVGPQSFYGRNGSSARAEVEMREREMTRRLNMNQLMAPMASAAPDGWDGDEWDEDDDES